MKISFIPTLVSLNLLAISTALFAAEPPSNLAAENVPVGYKLAYEQKFDGADALKDFRFTDPSAWHLAKTNETTALELVKQSKYAPIVRSPVNIALIADKVFGDFVLEADAMPAEQDMGAMPANYNWAAMTFVR